MLPQYIKKILCHISHDEDRTERYLIEQGLYYEGANGVNVMSSTHEQPQTCTEAATTYYNYTANETNDEWEHQRPPFQTEMRKSGILEVYSQNYLLRCNDRQQECMICIWDFTHVTMTNVKAVKGWKYKLPVVKL